MRCATLSLYHQTHLHRLHLSYEMHDAGSTGRRGSFGLSGPDPKGSRSNGGMVELYGERRAEALNSQFATAREDNHGSLLDHPYNRLIVLLLST